MERVHACTKAQTGNITQVLVSGQGPRPEWALQQAQTGMQAVASGIDRELEIKFREQEAFPAQRREQEAVPMQVIAMPDPPDLGFGSFLRAFG